MEKHMQPETTADHLYAIVHVSSTETPSLCELNSLVGNSEPSGSPSCWASR